MIEEQNQLLQSQEWQRKREHEERMRLERERDTARREKEFDDKIYNLKYEIAKATDTEVKQGLQALLIDAEYERDSYYIEKQCRQEELELEEERRQKEWEAEERKRKIAETRLERKQKLGNFMKGIIVLPSLIIVVAGLFYLLGKVFIDLNQSTVPNLRGMELVDANSELQALDLRVGTVIETSDATLVAGQVIQSMPDAGTKISRKGKVDLFVVRESDSTAEEDNIDREEVSSNTTANQSGSYSSSFATNQSEPFTVTVTQKDLRIRTEPSLSAAIVDTIEPNTYTIVEKADRDGHRWGRLKSGKGWISLSVLDGSAPPSQTVNTKDLTTDQVKKWVLAVYHDDFLDIGAILPVEAYPVGMQVPGQIKAIFNRARGGASQRIGDRLIVEYSKSVFNRVSGQQFYTIENLQGNILENLPDFDLEELVISYLQIKENFMCYLIPLPINQRLSR